MNPPPIDQCDRRRDQQHGVALASTLGGLADRGGGGLLERVGGLPEAVHASLDLVDRLPELALEAGQCVGDALDTLLGGEVDLLRCLFEIGVAERHENDQPAIGDRHLAECLEELGVAVFLVLAAERVGASAQAGQLPCLVADVRERIAFADLGPVAPGSAVGVDGRLEGNLAVAADGVRDLAGPWRRSRRRSC